jgi:hypothetical protein
MTKKGNEHEHAIEIPTFLDIARRIVPDETPSWLAAHLGWSSQGLQYDRLVDQYRPSKAETATRLDALTEALGLVQRELDDPSIRNLLEDAKYIKHLSGSSGMVRDLAQRADLAHISPGLTTKSGKTKRGRGKPKVPNLFGAKVLCAARVVETWVYFRQTEPGLANLDAAAIAQG